MRAKHSRFCGFLFVDRADWKMVLSELGVPTYYNVPQWSANAVYCDGIGKQNEFNREYSNICFQMGKEWKIKVIYILHLKEN